MPNPIPGYAAPTTTDRLTDAQGDVAVLTQSATIMGGAVTDVLLLPPNFGIAQEGPFFTYVSSQGPGVDAGCTVIAIGDTEAYSLGNAIAGYAGAQYTGFPGMVVSVLENPTVTDIVIGEIGANQDATTLPLRYTQAGPSQAQVDIETVIGTDGATQSGTDCNGRVYGSLCDYTAMPAANTLGFSLGSPVIQEAMLAWDYTNHILKCSFDGENWLSIMPKPPSTGTHVLTSTNGVVSWV